MNTIVRWLARSIGGLLIAVAVCWGLWGFLFQTVPVPDVAKRASAGQRNVMGEPATLVLTAKRVILPERRMEVEAAVEMPAELLDLLYDGSKNTPLLGHTDAGLRCLKSDYRDVKFRLVFMGQLPDQPGMDRAVPVPVSSFAPSCADFGRTAGFRKEFELGAGFARPEMYPSDYGWFTYIVRLEIPAPFSLREGNHFAFNVPLCVRFQPGTADDGRAIRFAATRPDEFEGEIDVLVMRSAMISLFTYVLSAVPMILALLLAHALFCTAGGASIRPHEMLVGAAAILLALLPLRAVLVPPDVPSLTRVDVLLGSGILLIVSIVCFRYVADVRPGPAGQPTVAKLQSDEAPGKLFEEKGQTTANRAGSMAAVPDDPARPVTAVPKEGAHG